MSPEKPVDEVGAIFLFRSRRGARGIVPRASPRLGSVQALHFLAPRSMSALEKRARASLGGDPQRLVSLISESSPCALKPCDGQPRVRAARDDDLDLLRSAFHEVPPLSRRTPDSVTSCQSSRITTSGGASASSCTSSEDHALCDRSRTGRQCRRVTHPLRTEHASWSPVMTDEPTEPGPDRRRRARGRARRTAFARGPTSSHCASKVDLPIAGGRADERQRPLAAPQRSRSTSARRSISSSRTRGGRSFVGTTGGLTVVVFVALTSSPRLTQAKRAQARKNRGAPRHVGPRSSGSRRPSRVHPG